ncbi:Histidine kinase- DNA gyrase B- and HSP90-like ATPase [Carpediemonas membranifera]|uniref:Histidine kinase- DNA gyrase B- and HSP90-like ATPase n=1 Tax=Carpediemonas membranifera TaxID=201153 RepID=A0A8J6E4P6_9EUKA|nr:Histidine kinase- DNA gyrase B- and HSP90-like ATPase [Carpediemonas membranifera]|eukprot:KAG9397211.1 Histidine kinase- DNA gyrase B- and HSP90-like ATPase [Carpediemonas membranifera]
MEARTERMALMERLISREREIKALRTQCRSVAIENECLEASLRQSNALFVIISAKYKVMRSNNAFQLIYNVPSIQHRPRTLFRKAVALPSALCPRASFTDHLVSGKRCYSINWTVQGQFESGRLVKVAMAGAVESTAPSEEWRRETRTTAIFRMMDKFAEAAFWFACIDRRYTNGCRIIHVSHHVEEWFEVPATDICNGTALVWLQGVDSSMRETVQNTWVSFITGLTESVDIVYRAVGIHSGKETWIRSRAVKLPPKPGSRAGSTWTFGTMENITRRVEMERVFAKEDMIFDMIRRYVSAVVLIVDIRGFARTGRCESVVASQYWETVTGTPVSFFDGSFDPHSLRPLLVPDEADWFMNRLRLFLLGKGPFNISHRFINQCTGNIVHMRTRSGLVRDDSGRPVTAIIMAADTTAKHLLAADKAQTRPIFEQLSRAVGDVFYLAVPDPPVAPGHDHLFLPLTFVSDSSSSVLGIAPELLCSYPDLWIEQIVPKDRERFIEAIREYKQACKVDPRHARLAIYTDIEVDGEFKHVLCTNWPALSLRGSIRHFVGLWVDRTSIVRTEKQLLEAIQRFDLISNTVDSLFYLIVSTEGSSKYKILYINKRYEEWTSRTRETYYARGSDEWWEQVHPSDRESAKERFTAVSGIPRMNRQYRMNFDDGTERHVINRTVHVTTNDDLRLLVGVVVDVSDMVIAQQQKSDAQAQLYRSQRLESLGVLAGGVSHDLNNILAVILGDADMILDDLDPISDARLHSLVSSIISSCMKAGTITGKLLAYSGQGQMSVTDVNLTTLALGMADFVHASLPPNVTVYWKLSRASTLPSIKGDPTQLQQVIVTILTNAVEAIEPNAGFITVSCGFCPVADRRLYLSVADTGCGMSEETISRMFDPLFSTKGEFGRGLGMAAVQGIVQHHGGVITAKSTERVGSVIRMTFPIADCRRRGRR